MVKRDGQYYYAPHGRIWGVWLYHEDGVSGAYGEFIKFFNKKEDAKDFVYKNNGWKN